MGEEKHGCFDDKVVCRGPLAARFNFHDGFWFPKLDFSMSNTSDTFVSAVDVMERAEDDIEVDRFSLNEGIPFRAGESRWGTCSTSNPSLDSGWIPLEDLKGVSGLVTTWIGMQFPDSLLCAEPRHLKFIDSLLLVQAASFVSLVFRSVPVLFIRLPS